MTGTVRDSATTTVSGAEVQLFTTGGVAIGDSVTSDDGTYGFVGLAAGAYFVCVRAEQATGSVSTTGYADQCLGGHAWDGHTAPTALTAGAVVVVGGVASARTDLLLGAAGAIGGTVTGPGGPASGVLVQVYSAAGIAIDGANAYTDGSGTYAVTGLSAGDYDVCFDPSVAGDGSGAALAGQCWSGVAWDPTTAPPSGVTAVAVHAGATATVTARLAAA